MIRDDAVFELTRPLNDLPFFADGDSMIPGFNTVEVTATTTADPVSYTHLTLPTIYSV